MVVPEGAAHGREAATSREGGGVAVVAMDSSSDRMDHGESDNSLSRGGSCVNPRRACALLSVDASPPPVSSSSVQ